MELSVMHEAESLLALPDEFAALCESFPERVQNSLQVYRSAGELVQMDEAAQMLAKLAAKAGQAVEAANHIQLGRLMILAELGKVLPRTTGGRGKKNLSVVPTGFGKESIAAYRKVADNCARIDEYAAAVQQANADGDADVEMSLSGFVRFVASGGNLKSHQNNGVIEWYTPKEYIDASREAMGSIDVDPASNKTAQKIVKADAYYTKATNGLDKKWTGNVFLNPPFKADLIKAFVSKLIASYVSRETTQAILLTNNNTDTEWWHDAAAVASSILFTKGRIKFYNPAGEPASPTNGHTLLYLGNRVREFREAMSQFGLVLEK